MNFTAFKMYLMNSKRSMNLTKKKPNFLFEIGIGKRIDMRTFLLLILTFNLYLFSDRLKEEIHPQ